MDEGNEPEIIEWPKGDTTRDATCTFEGGSYPEGTIICHPRSRTRWQCGSNGEWMDLEQKC